MFLITLHHYYSGLRNYDTSDVLEQMQLSAKRSAKKREQETIELRIEVLSEEIEELLDEVDVCRERVSLEKEEIATIDSKSAQLDKQVEEFMEKVKRRKHAFACQRATHEEKIRQANEEIALLNSKVVIARNFFYSFVHLLYRI
eukprot:m.176682 g.176682  ORF g.176682 m.176682 type:complete len:144 (-) comp15447_c1_seq2:666-1097(-)